jgi:EmrB/QacA subfamily drug resistance transporter
VVTAHRAADGTSVERRGLALFALTLGVFLVTINVTLVIVALPDIQADLGGDRSETAWIVDAYTLVGASLLLSAGSIADRFGRKRVLVAGYVILAGAAALCAVAPTIGWLLAFRVLMGIGGTVLTPTSMAIVANLYPDTRERARAIGLWGVSAGVGTGLGPIIGGAITDGAGWRAVFAANAIAGAIAVVIVIRSVPRSRSPVPRPMDLPGQVLAVAFLATLTYALIEAPSVGWGSAQTVGLFAAAALFAVAFLVLERRTAHPLVDLHTFDDRQFTGSIVITVAIFFVFAAFIYENAIYLQDVRGFSALEAGLLTLPVALPSLIGGPLAGRLVGIQGPRAVLCGGVAVMAVGMTLLAALPGDVDITILVLCELVLGIGYGVINAPISVIAVAGMPPERAGVAAAVASSARNVGLVIGIAVVGSAVTSSLPDTLPTGQALYDAVGDALRVGYGICAAVLVVAAIVGLRTLRAEPPQQVRAAAA